MELTRDAVDYRPHLPGREARPGHDHDPASPSRRAIVPPRPAPAGRLGRGPVGVDQALHGTVHVLDAPAHRGRHGRVRGAAPRRLRPPLRTVSAAARRGFDPAAYSLSRFFPAQLAIGVLGVVIVTSEYVVREPIAARPGWPEGGSDRRGPPRTLCM